MGIMQNSWKKLLVVAVAAAALSVMGVARSTARAEEHKPNACGCYQNTAGVCICGRPSKCGCPEECEPKGCAEKRQKELDKEIQAETKKAEEADKKRREEEAAKVKAAEAKAAEEQAAKEWQDDGTTAADETAPPTPKDKSKKTKDNKDKKEDKKGAAKKEAKQEPKQEAK
jgi:hypothetical protein